MDLPRTICAPERGGLQIHDWGTHDPLAAGFVTSPPELAAEILEHFGADPVGVCNRAPRSEAAPLPGVARKPHAADDEARAGARPDQPLGLGSLRAGLRRRALCRASVLARARCFASAARSRARSGDRGSAPPRLPRPRRGHRGADRRGRERDHADLRPQPRRGTALRRRPSDRRRARAHRAEAAPRPLAHARGARVVSRTHDGSPDGHRLQGGCSAGRRAPFASPSGFRTTKRSRASASISRDASLTVASGPASSSTPIARRSRASCCCCATASTGGPAFRRVERCDRLYQGPKLGLLPDLLAEWSRDAEICALDIADDRPDRGPLRRRAHRRPPGEGLFLAAGPALTPKRVSQPVSVMDFGPTIAAWLGVGLADVDGEPIPELLGASR